MDELKNLQPEAVFDFFREIAAIPHGSGNTGQISDYLVKFAKDRGLEYYQDEANNVVIFKPASPGYEDAPRVMIQGHMDMVCEKTPDSAIDMEKNGLTLAVDGTGSMQRIRPSAEMTELPLPWRLPQWIPTSCSTPG